MDQIQDKNQLGFPITTLREIKLLQKLEHKNILNINQVVYDKQQSTYRAKSSIPIIYICLDLMECDLSYLIRQPQYIFTCSRIRSIIREILQGLKYLHSQDIAHRDIKPSNILISRQGQIKIADFGLAKKLTHRLSTVKVVTMWYRAPELLLGLKNYTTKIDIWSVGCLFAQLIIRQPLFKEQKAQRQLIQRIYQLMGTPDQYEWSEALNLETYIQTKPQQSYKSQIVYHIRKSAPNFEGETLMLDLLQKMLRLNPHSRQSAQDCLKHPFLSIESQEDEILPLNIIELKQNQGTQTISKKIKIN